MQSVYYREHYPESPGEFLDAVSLRGANFVLLGKYQWLFRGQPGRHPLVPTAWRENAMSEFSPDSPVETYGQLVRAETEIARRFFRLADVRGLELPEDTQRLRTYIYENRELSFAEWPPKEFLPLLALARHFGLPARLLDWTWNPYVGAYFAAAETIRAVREKGMEEAGALEVYALSVDVFDTRRLAKTLGVHWRGGGLRLVTAPTAGNQNLRAQEGAFTLLDQVCGPDAPIPRAAVEALVRSLEGNGIVSPLLHRFVLPAKDAWMLLYLLAAEGVSASSVWPGYGGVALEVAESMQEGIGSL